MASMQTLSMEDTRMYFLWTIPSMITCLLAFRYLTVKYPNHTVSMKDNIIAFWHAVIVTILSGYSLFVLDPPLFTSIHAASTHFHQVMFSMSMGYFMFDFGRNIYYRSEDLSMMCHHLIVLTVYVMTISKGMFGYELCAIIFGTEISNPSLHVRRFLRSTDNHKTWYARVNDILLVGLFSVMRIGFGSWMTYKILVTPHPHTVWMFRVTMSMLYVLSWYWFIMMLRMGKREVMRLLSPTVNNNVHNGNGDCKLKNH